MNVETRLLTINKYSRPGEKQNKIEYIVVHYVGNANTKAIANRNYFNNLAKTHTTYASSHYIVGLEGEIIMCIPEDEVAFHSGSYSMNRKSIGIETCHPDWSGKFNDRTYDALAGLVAELCRKYNLGIDRVIRHYDVTGKNCPKYYVEHSDEWEKFKAVVYKKMTGADTPPKQEPGSEEKPMKTYHNGSTKENVYADTHLSKKIGSLAPYETCECFGIYKNRALVRYRVDGTDNYKIGFAKWLGGVR